MTTMPDRLIYVSRLLTDRAMAHLRSLGVAVRAGDEHPPSRAELEAGIAGSSAAVITLTERVDAALLAAKAAVCRNDPVGFPARRPAAGWFSVEMGAELRHEIRDRCR